jgi:hypothetical protein
VDALKAEPALANDLAWCLEALGDRSLPFVRGLYDHADVVPRLAALRAGARLGDPMAAAPLMAIASGGSGMERLDAISLLSEIAGTPRIDLTLHNLLSEKELLVRIAAYEALAKRAEHVRLARMMDDAYGEDGVPIDGISASHREVLARAAFPSGMIQGIERYPIAGKFLLDLVPVGDPLIYVTQQGQPRIVVFGERPTLHTPSIVTAWNDRLMISADGNEPGVRMMFRPDADSPASRITTESASLDEIIQLFAASTSPDQPQPGFDFTYSEVVGALYAISQSRATDCAFATERDRLKAGIAAASEGQQRRDRPETPGDPQTVMVIRQPSAPAAAAKPESQTPKIVPLPGTKERNDSAQSN